MKKFIYIYIRKKNNANVCPFLVVVYELHVYTGSKLGAETDSNVYVTLIGTRGDAGKRKLHISKNNKIKFQHGQVKGKMFKTDQC